MKGILVIFALLIILPVSASAKTGEKSSYGTTNPSSFTHEQSAAKIIKGDVCKASLSKCNDDLSCLFQVSVAQKHCSIR